MTLDISGKMSRTKVVALIKTSNFCLKNFSLGCQGQPPGHVRSCHVWVDPGGDLGTLGKSSLDKSCLS